MKIEYDQEVDALYIRIQEKVVSRTKELEEGMTWKELFCITWPYVPDAEIVGGFVLKGQ